MSNTPARRIAHAIIVLMFAASLLLYPFLPDRIATHWNAQGEVDGYMPKLNGLFLMPILILGLYLVFRVVPAIDPLKENIATFRPYYDGFISIFLAILAYLHVLTLLWNLGLHVDLLRAMAPAFGLLIFCTGVLMEHVRPNWFIGIRTPWTLSSPTVWARTHERAARTFKIAGVVTAFGVLLPSFWALLFVLVPMGISSTDALLYSYRLYQDESRK